MFTQDKRTARFDTSQLRPAADGDARLPITIVIPCFNEEESIPSLLEALQDFESQAQNYRCEFLLVDDGSADGTLSTIKEGIANRENFRVAQHVENMGIMAALMTGIREARSDVVCSMDSDCTYAPAQLLNLIPRLTDGVDLVTGSPYHPEGKVLNVPAWRLVISRTASWIYRRAMAAKLYTYTSCFRVYRRSQFVDMQLRHDGFVGVAEMIWRLSRRGGTVVEVPATLDVRKFGQSKMRIVEVTARHLGLISRALFFRMFGATLPHDKLAKPRFPAKTTPEPIVHCPD